MGMTPEFNTKSKMINPTLSLVIVLCIISTFTPGCTSNRAYRTAISPENPALPVTNPTNAVIEASAEYKLGFVEIDDQGWFYDPRQKEAVEDMINQQIGKKATPGSAAIIVLFVHGWKNNAAFDNTNVQTFRIALKQLSALENTLATNEQRPPRVLIGVYAGWRGLSIKSDYFPIPLGKETTFWSRKNAAQRVGAYGAMTELIMNLEELQRTANQALPTNATQTKLIIVGHSFGADAVYHSISQIVTERFVDTQGQAPGQVLKPIGDQVIFLNPAFEAARFYDLEQLARSLGTYAPDQRPVLSVFQSKGDWATRDVFPIGQWLGTLFQRYSSRRQKKSNLSSVGWYQPFLTHELRFMPDTPAAQAASTVNPTSGKHELRSRDKLPGVAENIMAQRKKWRSASEPGTTNTFGSCVMISTPHYKPRDPIVVVSVDKAIMKDHDDIGNPVLINFLQEYIPFCDDETVGSKQK